MRIYIAGKMTGLPDFNYPAFNEAAAALRALGYDVCNPAETDGGSSHKSREFYLREALKLLLECDHMALLPGWETSEGVRLEMFVAIALKMKVRGFGYYLEHAPSEVEALES
jgi:hypothetical protein